MSDWKLPWQGACRCGQVRLRVTGRPLLAGACHCTGCQRMSASAFSLSIAIPSAGFAIVEGKPVIGGLHGTTRHYFCPHCMSWMFTRPEGFDQFVNLRPSMLDAHGWFVPFMEVWTRERLPWARTPARHSFATQPELGQYVALIKEFERDGARPD